MCDDDLKNAFSLHKIFVDQHSVVAYCEPHSDLMYKYWRNIQIKRRTWIFSMFSCLLLAISIITKFNSLNFFLQFEFFTKQFFITNTVNKEVWWYYYLSIDTIRILEWQTFGITQPAEREDLIVTDKLWETETWKIELQYPRLGTLRRGS